MTLNPLIISISISNRVVTARGRRFERSYEAGVDTGTSPALYSMKEISLNDFKSLK